MHIHMCENFSATTVILREINFGKSIASEIALFGNFIGFEFLFW